MKEGMLIDFVQVSKKGVGVGVEFEVVG